MPKILIVEGNISAGKSTYTVLMRDELLSRGIHAVVASEDIEIERLTYWLTHRETDTGQFQIYVLKRRILAFKRALAQDPDVIICDRGPIGDRSFASYHHNGGRISVEDFEEYEVFFQTYYSQFERFPTTYRFIDVTAEKSMERVIRRQSANEATEYTVEYLADIIESHKLSFKKYGIPLNNITWPDLSSEDMEARIRIDVDDLLKTLLFKSLLEQPAVEV